MTMRMPSYREHRSHLGQILGAALEGGNAEAAVRNHLALEKNFLSVGAQRVHLASASRVFVIAMGKAAAAMCGGAYSVLRSRLSSGIAAVPKSTMAEPPDGITYIRGGHPLPNEGSLAAARASLAMLRETTVEDVVLFLISGGGSAMFEFPRRGISLHQLRSLSQTLLLSGIPIGAVNQVRARLSEVKAGGLLRWAAPARCIGLILSDVVGDDLARVASGPTIPSKPEPPIQKSVLDVLPPWAHEYVANPTLGAARPLRSAFPQEPVNVLIGSNRDLTASAQAEARRLAFPVRLLTEHLSGEASDAGTAFAARLALAERPICILMGGETTVTVRGAGRGGRNQEFALAAAIMLANAGHVALMAVASDGIDGPTDAAGAIVTGETRDLALRLGVDVPGALSQNNAYPCLATLGSLLFTGPTGTNVNDLVVGLAYRHPMTAS